MCFHHFYVCEEKVVEALGGLEEGRCHSSVPFKGLLCSALST